MRRFLTLFTVLMLSAALAFTQNRVVTGIVTDNNGAPVEGATVRLKGAKTGTAADINGAYSISVPAGATLVISGVGITQREISIGNQTAVNISVTRNVSVEETVVVTALGIRRSEKALGYAVAKVDPNVLLQKSEPDILKGLQGKVPGVDIRQGNGTPGAATRIQIRGVSSLSLETQPLFVVDGVAYSNDRLETSGLGASGNTLADLDPNDIESMNILKGAAASSLYGSRASRGVVVITTKSGSGKKGIKPFNVTFKTGYSVETIANLPDFQNTFGNGAQQRVGLGSNGSWGGRFGLGNVYNANGDVLRKSASGVDSVPAWGSYLAAYPELFDNLGQVQYVARPNNVKDMFRNGQVFENSIGVNGGSDNTTFNMTASNVDHKGYVENSGYVRNNFGIGGQTIYKNLTLGGNVSFSSSKQKGGFFGNNSGASQFGRTLYQGRAWSIPDYPSVDKSGKPIEFLTGQYTNPIWGAYHNTITTRDERTLANLRAGYKLNTWISFNYTFGVNTSNIFRDEILDEFTQSFLLGQITEDSYRSQEIQSTFVAIFTPKIGKNFTLDLKLGNSISHNESRRQAQRGGDLIVPGLFSITNTVSKTFVADTRNKRRLVGIFADATLGFRNFAFLNVTGRQDRTSTLPFDNATYFYPGVSGTLIWTDAFKLKSNVLDYGKIRAAYAKVGNDAEPQRGQDLFALSTVNFLGQPFGSRSGSTNDPDLTPEFTTEFEIGTDLSLFKRRVNLDFSWYSKSSTNLIYPIDVPVTTGYSSFFTNIGEMTNKGIEVGLNLRPVVSRNFTWDIRAAYTRNKNLVVRLVDGLIRTGVGGLGLAFIEAGYPYGYLRGTSGAKTTDGQLLIDPSNGWVVETPITDFIGDVNPHWKLGITNSFNFKGFSLSGLFDMTVGGRFYSQTINTLLGRGVTRDLEDRETSWVINGVYADPASFNSQLIKPLLVGGKTVPNQTRISTNDLVFASGSNFSSTFAINGHDEYSVFDGTAYRLRELTLGYDLPASIVKKLKVSGINFSLSGRNLWYIAPNLPRYTNFDPESNSTGDGPDQGVEQSAAPTTRRVGVNLNITF